MNGCYRARRSDKTEQDEGGKGGWGGKWGTKKKDMGKSGAEERCLPARFHRDMASLFFVMGSFVDDEERCGDSRRALPRGC